MIYLGYKYHFLNDKPFRLDNSVCFGSSSFIPVLINQREKAVLIGFYKDFFLRNHSDIKCCNLID